MKYSFVLEEKQGTNDWEADFFKKINQLWRHTSRDQ